MTALLVDSHVLLWVLADDPRLGPRSRSRLAAAPGVHVSAVTYAELTIKAMLGKLTLPADVVARVTESGFRPAPLTAEDATTLTDLPDLARHDPFDRLLLTQASRNGWDFVTADSRLLALGLPWVRDAQE